jgi:peptidoglycan hydrolase-like protein with peptidoglycan-binding domain
MPGLTTVAKLIADASGYIEGMTRSVAATDKWQASMDKADLASRKMAVSAESAAQRAAAAETKMAAAAQEATAAQEELAATSKALADGEITAAEAATRQAAAEERLAAANRVTAQSAIAIERASIAQAEAHTAAGRAAAVAAGTTEAAASRSARATEGTAAAATRGGGAFATFGKLATVAVAGIGYESIKTAAEFQKSTNVYVTAAGETTDGLKTVRKGIQDIAVGTGVPIKELTDGMYLIEKAGYRGADALKVEKAAAQGSAEENANLATVTNAVTSIMASYGLKADSAVSVTNELKAAAGESKTTMEGLAGSLSTVVPFAAKAGISFAGVAGEIATMTQHGETADVATQHLAYTIQHLQNPTAVMQKAMAQVGISSQDVSTHLGDGPGGRGLAGTINYLTDTVLHKMGPAGTVLLTTFNQNKQAAQDVNTMIAAMPPQVQKLAQSYADGSLTIGDYRKAFKGLPTDQQQLAKQFASLEDRSRGFNTQLVAGLSANPTYMGQIAKMTGGQVSLATVLQTTGESAQYVSDATARIAEQARLAGTDVAGWKSTQTLFNTQLGEFKNSIVVAGTELGTALLPVATKVMEVLRSGISVVERHGTLFRDLAIAVGAVVIPMYAATKAVALYQAAVRGVAAVQAVWTAVGVAYTWVATKVGILTGSTLEMEAAQSAVQVKVEQQIALLNEQSVATTEASAATGELAGQMGLFGTSEATAAGETDALIGQLSLLSEAELTAGRSAAVSGGEIASAGAASGAAGAGAGAARAGFLGLGGGMGATIAKTGGLAVGLGMVTNGIHDLTSGQKQGDTASKQFLATMNAQHNSLSANQDAIKKTTDKINDLKSASSYFKGLGGIVTGGLMGNDPLKSVSEANQLKKGLKGLQEQEQNLQTSTRDLGAQYGLNDQQVQSLATKYGVDLNGSVTQSEAKFRALQGAAGVTGGATQGLTGKVDTLHGALSALPPSKSTTITTPGLQQAILNVSTFQQQLLGLHDKSVTVTTYQHAVTSFASNFVPMLGLPKATGGLVGRADGGLISGPGTGTSDSILGVNYAGIPTARVSNGEYVVNAQSTEAHLPLLDFINNNRFASGGRVRGGDGAALMGLAGGGIVEGDPRWNVATMGNHRSSSLSVAQTAEANRDIMQMGYRAGATRGDIIAVQRKLGIRADGILGPQTLRALRTTRVAEDGSRVPASFYTSGHAGMIQAEDGSWVPPSFYAHTSTGSSVASSSAKSGMIRAEDGSYVPASFYADPLVKAEDGSVVPRSFYSKPKNYAEDDPRFNFATMGNFRGGSLNVLQTTLVDKYLKTLGYSAGATEADIVAEQRKLGLTANGMLNVQTLNAFSTAVKNKAALPGLVSGIFGALTASNPVNAALDTDIGKSLVAAFPALAGVAAPAGGASTSSALAMAVGNIREQSTLAANPSLTTAQYAGFTKWAAMTKAADKNPATHAQALAAQALAVRARSQLAGGPEYAAKVTNGTATTRDYSWLGQHATPAQSTGTVHVQTVLQLEGKVLYDVLKAHALTNEKRTGSNGLSAKRP